MAKSTTRKLVRRGADVNDICTRYRPRRLSEVVGIEPVINGLRKAIEQGESRSKAYLFAGTPGSGKTTLARVMAMGLNCEQGDTAEPCMECSSCKQALDKIAMHIVELNLARLNKKEDAEEIVLGMSNGALTGRNKIYIFDEAQQLTKAAQNLLLKNLEEPPPNCYIFICTTEPYKLINTIRDRCETYEFFTPTRDSVIQVLRDVFNQEETWKLEGKDKKKFLELTKGFSVRGILKSIDKAVRGGLDTINQMGIEDEKQANVAALVYKGEFKAAVDALSKIEPLNPEGMRQGIRKYLTTCLRRQGFTEEGLLTVGVMACFRDPYYSANPESYLIEDIWNACCVFKSNEE